MAVKGVGTSPSFTQASPGHPAVSEKKEKKRKIFHVGLTKSMFSWLDCEGSRILLLVGMVSARKEWVNMRLVVLITSPNQDAGTTMFTF